MADHFSIGISNLKQALKGYANDNVYAYVIDTIGTRNSRFYQAGCGPNFLGDAVTLCTCKHWMRTFRSVENWKDAWIAGFCNVDANDGRHALVYLMRVAKAYESHRALWQHLSPHSRVQKSAHVNRLGDVYEPKRSFGSAFDISSYHPPILGHSHHRDAGDHGWRYDITCHWKSRRPAMLVGSPSETFLWNRPRILYVAEHMHPLGRGQKKLSVREFLGRLGK
jgi:hypothetical protein